MENVKKGKNKGLMVASFVGMGIGVWSIVSGQTVVGGVLIALCAVIVGMQVSKQSKPEEK